MELVQVPANVIYVICIVILRIGFRIRPFILTVFITSYIECIPFPPLTTTTFIGLSSGGCLCIQERLFYLYEIEV